MAEFKNVTSVAEFRALDESDILLGYLDGFDNAPCPGSDRSRAFFHGWRKGLVDGGHVAADADQMELDAAFAGLSQVSLH